MARLPLMQETAYAKINLALHVRAREPDGYHRIETLFVFAAYGDRLTVRPADCLTLDIEGPFASSLAREKDNLVLMAAEAIRGRFAVDEGAALILEKNLPVASGIGGGSADAAAALRLLDRFWKLDAGPVLDDVARGLGADVPACLHSRTARGEGRGDRLEFRDLPELSGAPVLLVNPGETLSTAKVFAAWDGLDRGPLGSWEQGRNDLESPACAILPVIGDVRDSLMGARIARMSGSGATCFGIYDSEAERDAAAHRIKTARPDWWVMPVQLR